MSTHKIDRTSSLDPELDESIRREVAETKEPGIGGDGEHERSPAGQEAEVESGEAKKEELEEEEEDQAPATVAPPTSATAANARTTFGMKRSNPTVKKGNDTYNYEQKYPEDAPFEEAAPAARVWRTYEDESRNYDANMVEESRDNVDVLLVFAGLFSAVVTTFVVQTSQSLQPDYAAMSASLLYESVLVQRAIANGSLINAIAPSPLNPTIAFVPATTDVWVNGLWFTSLFLSLTTALVAVLVKQWLHHYVALPSGTPRDRSFTRQCRYGGFEKWHVQVIIGLLPVLMHLALAIFLVGLVIFLHPLRQALSWVICAGTVLVYTTYVVTTILPILFPQCPYRTPLCDLVYISFHRIIPRVTWSSPHHKLLFLLSYQQRKFRAMFCWRPRVRARSPQSLTAIESKFVQQMSTDLAAEALHWLFSRSSNPTVQSIVIQSAGGLPMPSAKKFLELRGDSEQIMAKLQKSLLEDCILKTNNTYDTYEPVPGMELKLGRLLRFAPSKPHYSFIDTPGVYSFELTAAILGNGCNLCDGKPWNTPVSPGSFLRDNTRSSKLSPRGWYHIMMSHCKLSYYPLDPDHDNHANMFPLHLCSAILRLFDASKKSPMQDFDSPLVLGFEDALPYFLEEIYANILDMFSKFVNPSFDKLSLHLRVFVAATEFILHRLALPDSSDMFHKDICMSLSVAVNWINRHKETFSLQEATAFIQVLEDIMAQFITGSDRWSDWNSLFPYIFVIHPYQSLTAVAPSACSLRGLQSMVDYMKSHWDQVAGQDENYESEPACWVLTNFLATHIPVAFTVFLDKQCLDFLGNHVFRGESVGMVRAYVAGILTMQQGSDGAVDAETLQQHIGYLSNPQNCFAACSILATHGIRNIDRAAIRRDITTLVQLCPTRDAAWDECCGKLRDLAESDGGDFFSKQFVVKSGRRRPLQAEEIQIEKDNIKYAIQVLDNFFNGRAHTVDLVPSSMPVLCTTGQLDHAVGWCRRRKADGKPEQKQEV